jgi:hypothetical protein
MVTKLCKEITLNLPLLPNHSLPNLIFFTIKFIVIEFLTTLIKMLSSENDFMLGKPSAIVKA